MVKTIVTTPIDIKLTFVVPDFSEYDKYRNIQPEKSDLEWYQDIKDLLYKTNGKHFYIEYDENNGNIAKTLVDLDLCGLWPITLEGFLEYFYEIKYNEGEEI